MRVSFPRILMDIPSLLKSYSDRVEDLLAREMPPDSVPYLSEGVWYQFSSGGKRLRPAVCVSSSSWTR